MQENIRAEVQKILNKLSDGKFTLPVWNHAFEGVDFSLEYVDDTDVVGILDYWTDLQEVLLGGRLNTKEEKILLELMKVNGYKIAYAFSSEVLMDEDSLERGKGKFWKLVSLALSNGYNLEVVGVSTKDGALENFWIVLKYT